MSIKPVNKAFGAVFVTALLAVPSPFGAQTIRFGPDSRTADLQRFFESYQCPRPYHVVDYLEAADAYDVDYRLLPAISVRESTCGVYSRWNNHWGWNSLRDGF